MQLVESRDAERIRFAIQVQAGHLGELDLRVEAFGIGLSGEHFDVVAKLDEATAEVTDVHALPTTMRLAPIRQQGDAHGQFTRIIGRTIDEVRA